MERKRKRNKEQFPQCHCGGDRFIYRTEGRTQRIKCDRCGETSKQIKFPSTMYGTKEHSE